jgi:cytochrome c biogenesis protein CcmG/thiol:disulfide interchange protein DsbE
VACPSRLLLILALMATGCCGLAARARADGDPGSDVLVYQNLFVGGDSGLTIAQQARLGSLLSRSAAAGRPIRVAIIAHPDDLGAVTALWQQPRAYARFLGTELSLAYRQRLLVVMPNGLGFYWAGHATAAAETELARVPAGAEPAQLMRAAVSGAQALTSSAAVPSPVTSTRSGRPAPGSAVRAASPGGASNAVGAENPTPSPGRQTDTTAAIIAVALLALVMLAAAVGPLRRSGRLRTWPRPRTEFKTGPLIPGLVLLLLVAGGIVAGTETLGSSGASGASDAALATNPNLDPGTALSRPAPRFRLTDQTGRQVSLGQYRGKVVLLAFTDSECTTVCPLTTAAMLHAKAMLGRAGAGLQLLGVDANPRSDSLEDVASYTELHGLSGQWRFATGTLPELRRVWKAYGIQADIQRGEIAHTPALFMISPQGRESRVYMTQQSYSAVGQFAQILARQAARLLPGHPPVDSSLSYRPIAAISPARTVNLPVAGGGLVRLGPGQPHLSLFFATWDQEITSLGGQLTALGSYESAARKSGLPGLTAIDEGSVEPSGEALPRFLARLGGRLPYQVAVDSTGRVADGYEVQGEPWFVLTSSSGRILWYWQVSTSGWPSPVSLAAHVRAALGQAPTAPASYAALQRALTHSPAPLGALHNQAGRLLGNETALAARIRSLRGYPVVLNVWASWCTPCRAEFSLFAQASERFGRRVAFLGADSEDSSADARTFLTQHPVAYPSYATSNSALSPFGSIEGLPTTIFLNRSGRVMFVHTGQYDALGSLNEDIESYALHS